MSKDSYENARFHHDEEVKYATAERSADFLRYPWSPTPLNPNTVYKDGGLYSHAAIGIIEEICHDADAYAEMTQIPAHVRTLLKPSLMAALLNRFENNSGKHLTEKHNPLTTELFAKAQMGAATPDELIALLHDAPELQSVELAKMSHPYQWRVTREMDEVVVDAVMRDEFLPTTQNDKTVRHYFARVDDPLNPRSMVVIRKEDIGTLEFSDNSLTLVKRDSYVLDLQHPLMKKTRQELALWLREIKRSSDLQEKVFDGKKSRYKGDELPHAVETALEFDYEDGFLYPMVSSYYVRT